MLIYRDFTFDSAHVLSDFSKDHPYGKVHGHSFRARIWIEGEINETNMLIDLGEVERECLKIKSIPSDKAHIPREKKMTSELGICSAHGLPTEGFVYTHFHSDLNEGIGAKGTVKDYFLFRL